MLFVRTNELKTGMRLARPIYNKNGVLLFERNTKLSMQGVYSIKNFGLIGIYILESAEPLPPMTEEDIAFERFQTMAVFSLKEIFKAIETGKRATSLPTFVSDIMKNYGHVAHKLNFMQNIRSKEDAIYKHSINTAILVALISNHMHMTNQEQIKLIMAALLHDCQFDTYKLDEEVKKIITQMKYKLKAMENNKNDIEVSLLAEILLVAYFYDNLTAMKLDEEPQSEVEAIRYLMELQHGFSKEAVWGLIDSINILAPGICVELTNGEKGVVITENKSNILRPVILCFTDNRILNLYYDSIFKEVQIKDIMKSMDNRFIMDRTYIEQGKNE
ncbi:MAG: phosphohydrolase [Velocimicrobium sp.]